MTLRSYSAAVLVVLTSCTLHGRLHAQEREDVACPKSWSLAPGFADDPLTLAGDRLDIPEYHDCQKFIIEDGDSLKYGALYAIFAWGEIENLEFILRQTARDRGVALDRVAVSAAEIKAYADYEPLNLKEGINCLFFWQGSTGWHARMIPRASLPRPLCNNPIDPGNWTLYPELKVVATTANTLGFGKEEDYPPVARWDWDKVGKQHYIGVKCGRAWCEVGHPSFTHSPTYVERFPGLREVVPREMLRIFSIKGWYDEQPLAIVEGGRARPSADFGAVFPHWQLDRWNTPHVFADGWTPVAYVAIGFQGSHADRYLQEFGFEALGARPDWLNTIYTCFGTRETCGVPSRIEACDCPKNEPNCGSGRWWAKIVGGEGPTTTEYKALCRYWMSDEVEIVATARLRWFAEDEGDWYRCANGCCELIGGG